MRRDRSNVISASDLAQSCVCEQQLVFDRTFGKKRAREQVQRAKAGIAVHADMNAQAQLAYRGAETSQPDRRCFIASALYGPDGQKTQALRSFRYRNLAPLALGRLFIEFYYRRSPPIAAVLCRSPRLAAVARFIVNGIFRMFILERNPSCVGGKKKNKWVKLVFSPLKFNVSAPPPNKPEIMDSYRLGDFIDRLFVWLFFPALALAIYVGWITGNTIYQSSFANLVMPLLIFFCSVIAGVFTAFLTLIGPYMLSNYSMRLQEEVAEIDENSEVSEALSLSEQYPEIEAYRKEVITQGRMFLKGDLKAMKCFAKKAKPKLDATELALQQYKNNLAHENMRRLLTP